MLSGWFVDIDWASFENSVDNVDYDQLTPAEWLAGVIEDAAGQGGIPPVDAEPIYWMQQSFQLDLNLLPTGYSLTDAGLDLQEALGFIFNADHTEVRHDAHQQGSSAAHLTPGTSPVQCQCQSPRTS